MELSIEQLAQQAGLTRRAVRFYVQQQLLSPPVGLGRGSFYDQSHLDRLTQVAQLQKSGHSLDAIKRILGGESNVPPPGPIVRPVRRAALSAQLLTRITLADGVELQFDSNRYQPHAEDLLRLRELVREVFSKEEEES